jgi:hypothetical protein
MLPSNRCILNEHTATCKCKAGGVGGGEGGMWSVSVAVGRMHACINRM